MNKQRRKDIDRLKNLINTLKDDPENILNDEQDYFDNMPENLQGSLRGEESEDAISNMEDAIENLSDAIESLEEVV